VPGEKFLFTNQYDQQLAARLDRPKGAMQAVALFAHCFTCTKDIFAANQIAKRLNDHAIGVLRFDFTGLGASEGEFENTNFSSNVDDILAAAKALEDADMPASMLIGHSLGGAAVLKAAAQLASIKAVVTIGAPFDPGHVEHNFDEWVGEIEENGIADVRLVGRPFKIKKQFLDDIRSQSIADDTHNLRAALLVMHSPIDQTVGIENAERIFVAAKHPKSFVSLDNADHLLSKRQDARYVADVIHGWASAYLSQIQTSPDAKDLPPAPASDPDAARMAERGNGPYTLDGISAGHHFVADEPDALGGQDLGPTPYHYLRAALGACTLITLRMYSGRKKWDMAPLKVIVEHAKEDGIDVFKRTLILPNDMPPGRQDKMLEIADKCPVHKTLERSSTVRTEIAKR
jgi:putative redox protein